MGCGEDGQRGDGRGDWDEDGEDDAAGGSGGGGGGGGGGESGGERPVVSAVALPGGQRATQVAAGANHPAVLGEDSTAFEVTPTQARRRLPRRSQTGRSRSSTRSITRSPTRAWQRSPRRCQARRSRRSSWTAQPYHRRGRGGARRGAAGLSGHAARLELQPGHRPFVAAGAGSAPVRQTSWWPGGSKPAYWCRRRSLLGSLRSEFVLNLCIRIVHCVGAW